MRGMRQTEPWQQQRDTHQNMFVPRQCNEYQKLTAYRPYAANCFENLDTSKIIPPPLHIIPISASIHASSKLELEARTRACLELELRSPFWPLFPDFIAQSVVSILSYMINSTFDRLFHCLFAPSILSPDKSCTSLRIDDLFNSHLTNLLSFYFFP